MATIAFAVWVIYGGKSVGAAHTSSLPVLKPLNGCGSHMGTSPNSVKEKLTRMVAATADPAVVCDMAVAPNHVQLVPSGSGPRSNLGPTDSRFLWIPWIPATTIS